MSRIIDEHVPARSAYYRSADTAEVLFVRRAPASPTEPDARRVFLELDATGRRVLLADLRYPRPTDRDNAGLGTIPELQAAAEAHDWRSATFRSETGRDSRVTTAEDWLRHAEAALAPRPPELPPLPYRPEERSDDPARLPSREDAPRFFARLAHAFVIAPGHLCGVPYGAEPRTLKEFRATYWEKIMLSRPEGGFKRSTKAAVLALVDEKWAAA